MARVICPGCRRYMEVDRHIEVGDWVSCPGCDADLEVISLNPLVLDWVDAEYENASIAWSSRASSKRAKWGRESKKGLPAKKLRYFDDED